MEANIATTPANGTAPLRASNGRFLPKSAAQPAPPAQPLPAKRRSNRERFMAMGRTEQEYYQWATSVGRRMHINTLDRLICQQMGVYTVAHLVQRLTDVPEGIESQEQLDEFIVQHSVNPLELAQLWSRVCADADSYVSVETVLDDFLSAFPQADFERFGDKNCLTDVAKSWFKRTGVNLDVQVEEISATVEFTVTVEDAIAFVKANRPGCYKNPYLLLRERIEERFKALTTFRLTDYYADHLIRSAYPVAAPVSDEPLPF